MSSPDVTDERSGTRTHVPGEAGLWILICADLFVFTILFAGFLVDRHDNPAMFSRSGQELTLAIGVANTLVLLTSSLLVARFVQRHRAGDPAVGRLALGAIGCGLLFLVLKVFEWTHLASNDFGPVTDTFFSWYFVLTGLHLVHLLFGLTGLFVARRVALRRERKEHDGLVVEGIATYWHMVDLLWLVIFPLVYLTAV
ncbi:MAG: cytochrome c oxidase subunit 3 [Solirubrobacteraceae bacterium]|nr:cytochrome c oxidase subunit 3 [Solirubrobacteraceae bacterium]